MNIDDLLPIDLALLKMSNDRIISATGQGGTDEKIMRDWLQSKTFLVII